jgi:hypothetical protein
MKQTFAEFFEEACSDLLRNGITFTLRQEPNIEYAGGCFFDQDKTLKVTTNRRSKTWRQIFLHEYCHFLQWKEKSKWFTTAGVSFGPMNFWEWLEGEVTLTPHQINLAINFFQGLERNCEQRAIKIIKDKDLGFDLEKYIKGANSYIMLYNVVRLDGKWCQIPPYYVPEVVGAMPGDRLVPLRSMKYISDKHLALIRKHCY